MAFEKFRRFMGERLGLRSFNLSLASSESIAMREDAVTRAAIDARVQQWESGLPDGLLEEPVQDWPAQLRGERVAMNAWVVMQSFHDPLQASICATSSLFHRFAPQNRDRWTIDAVCTGSKDRVAQETFHLVFERLAQDHAPASVLPTSKDPEATRVWLNEPKQGRCLAGDVVPVNTCEMPRLKLNPIWDDALFCADLARQMHEAPGPTHGDWDAAMNAAAFVVVACEHMSQSNLEHLVQSAVLPPVEGQTMTTSTPPRFQLSSRRVEKLEPGLRSAPRRSQGQTLH